MQQRQREAPDLPACKGLWGGRENQKTTSEWLSEGPKEVRSSKHRRPKLELRQEPCGIDPVRSSPNAAS